jgi:hypothetical protein
MGVILVLVWGGDVCMVVGYEEAIYWDFFGGIDGVWVGFWD